MLGENHAAVGAAIAVEWQFPDVVTDAIVIANMVAKNISMELGAEGFNLSVDSECVRRLELDFT